MDQICNFVREICHANDPEPVAIQLSPLQQPAIEAVDYAEIDQFPIDELGYIAVTKEIYESCDNYRQWISTRISNHQNYRDIEDPVLMTVQIQDWSVLIGSAIMASGHIPDYVAEPCSHTITGYILVGIGVLGNVNWITNLLNDKRRLSELMQLCYVRLADEGHTLIVDPIQKEPIVRNCPEGATAPANSTPPCHMVRSQTVGGIHSSEDEPPAITP